MRRVQFQAFIPDADAGRVFDTISQFERYPELVEVVRSVTVGTREADGQLLSTWEVFFRNGILTWTEADWLRKDALTIDFIQTEGDFDSMSGSWILDQKDTGTRIIFASEFDFGIPSLASIIDPVAERVLTETIQLILRRLFTTVEFPTPSHAAAPVVEGAVT
jgi:ribosome-associated toxin RatA of RatAB toxin-antitoxin module